MTQPRFTLPDEPIQPPDSVAEDVILEDVRRKIVASLRQTLGSGTLPPRWAKRFEKELRIFESVRFPK